MDGGPKHTSSSCLLGSLKVALKHHLVPPFTVVEEHPVSFLRDAVQERRGVLVLGCEHVFILEVDSYLYLEGLILSLQGRDGPVGIFVVPQAAQLELWDGGLGWSRQCSILALPLHRPAVALSQCHDSSLDPMTFCMCFLHHMRTNDFLSP